MNRSKTNPDGIPFTIWATSDAHVIREALAESVDPAAVPRESMALACRQADDPDGFHYDIGINLGDILDYDHETADNFRKYLAQLDTSSRGRHAWYHVGGNNDENSVLKDGVALDNEHYRKTIDPVGEFPAESGMDNSQRPFPVLGTYERYHVDIGNLRMLFLSDRNDLPAPYGRGEGGFYVDGAITLETYRWLVRQIIANPDRILAVCCHHPLKDTTIGSAIDDSWRGQFMMHCKKPFGANPPPQNRLQTVLHQVYDVDPFDSPKFSNLLGQNPGIVDFWLSGHVHHLLGQEFEGRGKYAHAFGGHHLNVGTLCRYRHPANVISAQSTVLAFRPGDRECESRVYVHDHPSLPSGFFAPETRRLVMKRAFSRSCEAQRVTSPGTNVQTLTIDRKSPDALEIAWDHPSTGLLIVKQTGTPPDFVPVDGQAYYAGERVGDATVACMGTARRFCDRVPLKGESVYYRAFAYNAGHDTICYHVGSPRIEPVQGIGA